MKKAATDPTPPKPRKKTATEVAGTKPPAPKTRRTTKKPSSDAEAAAEEPGTPESITLTVVAARVDIGFGNHLYLRGSGPGLSWDVGLPMSNAGCDLWTIDLLGARTPISCKFLINDEKWSAGPDYILEPGAQLEVTPLF